MQEHSRPRFIVGLYCKQAAAQDFTVRRRLSKPHIFIRYSFVVLCILHHVSEKNCATLFLSELRQIFTNFDGFWQKYGKKTKIMRSALIFHLT